MGGEDTELASVHFCYRQEAAREEGAPRPALYPFIGGNGECYLVPPLQSRKLNFEHLKHSPPMQWCGAK